MAGWATKPPSARRRSPRWRGGGCAALLWTSAFHPLLDSYGCARRNLRATLEQIGRHQAGVQGLAAKARGFRHPPPARGRRGAGRSRLRRRWNETDAVLGAAELVAGARRVGVSSPVRPNAGAAEVIGRCPTGSRSSRPSRSATTTSTSRPHRGGHRRHQHARRPDRGHGRLAMLCLLAASRRVPKPRPCCAQGNWQRWNPTELLGPGLQGKHPRHRRHGPHRPRPRDPRPCLWLARFITITGAASTPARAGATYHETLETMLPPCHFLSLNCPATADNLDMLEDPARPAAERVPSWSTPRAARWSTTMP
jgi:hypothetical protein